MCHICAAGAVLIDPDMGALQNNIMESFLTMALEIEDDERANRIVRKMADAMVDMAAATNAIPNKGFESVEAERETFITRWVQNLTDDRGRLVDDPEDPILSADILTGRGH